MYVCMYVCINVIIFNRYKRRHELKYFAREEFI